MSSSKQLAHMVYFTLNDDSQAKIDELVAACKEYLTNHPGLVYFSVGTLNPDLSRPVNDKGFHVVLNTVFADRAAHDAYQVAPRHNTFIEKCKPNWKQVRVFDSDLVLCNG
jgi:quinol monooxygenase YgiN